MSEAFRVLTDFKFNSNHWTFSDLRLDIPPLSHGSDAANPHTQYSNAVAKLESPNLTAFGISFTLGEGNQFVCQSAEFLLSQLDGVRVSDFLGNQGSFAEFMQNPLQLRWISPFSGLPMLAAGLVINTVIDYCSKLMGLPAWKFLSLLSADELLQLGSLRHLSDSKKFHDSWKQSYLSEKELENKFKELESKSLPAYFTTWIGFSAESLAKQVLATHQATGISMFKLKISPDIKADMEKLNRFLELMPENLSFALDSNQRLTSDTASEWMQIVSENNFVWLEEPFAPDNALLFSELQAFKKANGLRGEIASGENCPNLHTAQALMLSGIDRYQVDPCRMMGLIDGAISGFLAKTYMKHFTPHAGGAGLDELSPHLQLIYLARINPQSQIEDSLTENIGFCSPLYRNPTVVKDGKIVVPQAPGLIGGFSKQIENRLIPHREGITWLEHLS